MKTLIIKWLGHFISKWIEKKNLVLNAASTEFFRNKVKCAGEVHVNYPVSIRGGQYVSVDSTFFANSGLRMECVDEYFGGTYSPCLTIGKNVSFGCRCHIGCINQVEIGNAVLFGSNVLIIDHSHGQFNHESKDIPWADRTLLSKGAIVIEDNVWLCDNVSVLPGVTIGKGSVVGAGSVVTKDVPSYSLAAGNPAKIIKRLK